MMLPHNALVAVADGANFNLFINKGDETTIDLGIFEAAKIASANAGSGLRHHNEAANPDADRKREDGHAAAAAGHLNQLGLMATTSHVLIIADPRTLGELRKHYHPALQKKVIGEISKDLAGRSVDDIVSHIRGA